MSIKEEALKLDAALEETIKETEALLQSTIVDLEKEKKIERYAAAQGDRSENAEWQLASEGVGQKSAMIMLLEKKLEVLAEAKEIPLLHGEISMGSTVLLKDITANEELYIKIVPKGAGSAQRHLIAEGTPVVNGILGRRVGDTVDILAPRGTTTLKVMEVY